MTSKGTDVKAGRGVKWTGLAAMLLLLALDASAQGPQQRMRERGGDGPRTQRMMQESRPTPAVADDESATRRGRMSPEERRQLRRDVHDAGRDLYPGRMSPRRREVGRE